MVTFPPHFHVGSPAGAEQQWPSLSEREVSRLLQFPPLPDAPDMEAKCWLPHGLTLRRLHSFMLLTTSPNTRKETQTR